MHNILYSAYPTGYAPYSSRWQQFDPNCMKVLLIFALITITEISFGQAGICDSLDISDYPQFDSIKQFEVLQPLNSKYENFDTLYNFNEVHVCLLSNNTFYALSIKEDSKLLFFELPYASFNGRLDSSILIDQNSSGKKKLILYFTKEYYHVSQYNPAIEMPGVNNISESRYSSMSIIDIEQKTITEDFVISYYDKYTWFYCRDSIGQEVDYSGSWEYYKNINLDSLNNYNDKYLEEIYSSKTSRGKCQVVMKDGQIMFDCSYEFRITTQPTIENTEYIRNDSCKTLKIVNYDVRPEFLIKTN